MEHGLDLNLLAIFVRVVELRSFTAAAKSLRIPKSKASRAIKRLETDLDAPLLLRHTRLLELTATGQRLFAACVQDLASLSQQLSQALSDAAQTPRRIRIAAVEDMGAHLLPEVIARFSRKYPHLSFDLLLGNEQINLVREGVDLAVRVGALPQTSFRKRHLGGVRFIFVASARYGQRLAGSALAELARHPVLVLTGYHDKQLRLVNAKSEALLAISSRVAASTTLALLKLAEHDMGVALLPDFLCREGLARGSLVQLGEGWSTPAKKVSLVYTARLGRESVVKELGDAIFAQFRRHLGGEPQAPS